MAAILVLESLDACCAASDTVAPEHLLLAVHDGQAVAGKVSDYGALFVGYASTVPFGDYLAGPNHTLPTGRTARFSGGLTPLTFLRPQSWLSVQDGGASLAEDTAAFADMEGLAMHGEAARLRARREPR
jgi:histidinol dehydrogenase